MKYYRPVLEGYTEKDEFGCSWPVFGREEITMPLKASTELSGEFK